MTRSGRVPVTVTVLSVLFVLAVPAVLMVVSLRSGANFADSERFEVNRLGAGTVEISIDRGSADGSTTVDDPQTFSATHMAPGDVVFGSLAINNTGTLPLRFWITAASNPASSPLADWLLFDVWTGSDCSQEVEADRLEIGNLVLGPDHVAIYGRPSGLSGARRLGPSESTSICLDARLPLAAPNDVQAESVEVELIVHAEHDLEVSE